MNKNIVLAKIRRQQAEIAEMIEMLKEEKGNEKMIEILNKRCRETETLIEALEDKSVIPEVLDGMDIMTELQKITRKVEETKDVIEKIKSLESDTGGDAQ
ncbi:MAG TPA: hypothetical protein P5287_00090 [bacterium]|nr:hypothetical protein [bacterium]